MSPEVFNHVRKKKTELFLENCFLGCMLVNCCCHDDDDDDDDDDDVDDRWAVGRRYLHR